MYIEKQAEQNRKRILDRFLFLSICIFLPICVFIDNAILTKLLSFPRCFTVKEDEGRTLWLDTQSHASSSASSADDDYSWQWPTSFWSQFKVSTNVCSNYRIQCHFTRLSVLYLRTISSLRIEGKKHIIVYRK